MLDAVLLAHTPQDMTNLFRSARPITLSELRLIRARRVGDGSIASWRATVPLPLGFHGTVA
jgi:hypothetical protein